MKNTTAKVSVKDIRKCKTIGQLSQIGLVGLDYDVSYRGGYVGFIASAISKQFNIDINLLPKKIGAYCNYLGGGVRGTIAGSDYNERITGRKRIVLDAIIEACKRAYLNLENGYGMNVKFERGFNAEFEDAFEGEFENEETEMNWEEYATKEARKQMIVSAY